MYRAIPERDAEGRIVRWYSLRTDIDDRKQAEDRLQLLLDVTIKSSQICESTMSFAPFRRASGGDAM